MCNFFDLPRELRDHIYELSLVREGKISIVEIGRRKRSPNIRTTWRANERTKLPTISHSKTDFEVERSLMTYQMLPMSKADKPYLNLFLASRRMYHESRQTYYSQNRFSIGDTQLTSIAALLSFLYDRPLESLRYIRDLEMTFLPAWICLQMRFWEILCDELAQHFELRYLRLHIWPRVPEFGQSPTNDGWRDTPSSLSWVQGLIKSGNPQNLVLQFMKNSDIEKNQAFGAWFQKRLLKDGIMLKYDGSGGNDMSFSGVFVRNAPSAPLPHKLERTQFWSKSITGQ